MLKWVMAMHPCDLEKERAETLHGLKDDLHLECKWQVVGWVGRGARTVKVKLSRRGHGPSTAKQIYYDLHQKSAHTVAGVDFNL